MTGITLLFCTGIYIKFYSYTDKGPGDTPEYSRSYERIKSKSTFRRLQDLNVPENTLNVNTGTIGSNPNIHKDLDILSPSTTVTNINTNELKTKDGWIDYFKIKISSLIPGRSASTDLSTPLSQPQHQISITDNTQVVEINTITPNTPKAVIKSITPNIEVNVSRAPITSEETLMPGLRPWTPDFKYSSSNLGLTQLYTPQGQSVFKFSSEDINPLSTGSLTPKTNIVDSLDSPKGNIIDPLASTSTGFSTPKGNTIDPLVSTTVESLSPKIAHLPVSSTPVQNIVEQALPGSSRPVSPIPNLDNDSAGWV